VQFIESQNAWEKVLGGSEEVDTRKFDANSIGNAFELALGHDPCGIDAPSENSDGNRASADAIHLGDRWMQAGGKHSDSELSPAGLEIPEAISIAETGGTHKTCEGSPGTQSSGKHLTGDLSLAAHESENVESGSNHDEHEASPVPDLIVTNAGGMHLHDKVSLGCSERDLNSMNSSGIHVQRELSPAADSSSPALDTELATSLNTDTGPSQSVQPRNRRLRRQQNIQEPVQRSERIQKKPKDMRNYEVLRRVQQMHVEDRLSREAANNVFVATYIPLLEGQQLPDPNTFMEAWESPLQPFWKQAMVEELQAFQLNDTWNLVDGSIPVNSHAMGSRWVFKTKENPDSTIRYKARLVIKGYEQQYGVDFTETSAPVGRLDALRILIALAAERTLKLYHLDIVTAFLNPVLDQDDVYMLLPSRIQHINPTLHESQVVHLRKALYGLKQAPRLWNKDVDRFLLSLGFVKSPAEPSLYSDDNLFRDILRQIKVKYRSTDLGPVRRFLGLEITRLTSGGYRLSQEGYIHSILSRFGLASANTVSTPLAKDSILDLSATENDKLVDQRNYLSIIGSLMYAALGTRPDIAFAVTKLSQYNHKPRTSYLTAAKRVLRYLKSTITYGLQFSKDANSRRLGPYKLGGYTDADWARNPQDRKSISGYIFFLGAPVSWKSKRQAIIATSTTEAEFSAYLEISKQALWLRQLVEDISYPRDLSATPSTNSKAQSPEENQDASYPVYNHGCITIYSDSERAIATVKSEGITTRNKHFDIRLLKSRELQQHGVVDFTFIRSELNKADGFTKSLTMARHGEFVKQLGLE